MGVAGFWAFIATVLIAFGGCATTREVDAQVLAFAAAPPAQPPAAGSVFRFERLPSQGQTPADAALQTQLEQAVATRLNAFGMRAATDGAAFVVTVSARSQSLEGLSARPLWDHPGPFGFITPSGRWVWLTPAGHSSLPNSVADPRALHEVSVLVRASAGGVLHEAQARSQSRARAGSADAQVELLAMVGAALQNFPQSDGKAGAPRIQTLTLPLAKN